MDLHETIAQNIMVKLIKDSMPLLEDGLKREKTIYKPMLKYVSNMFLVDLKFMLEDCSGAYFVQNIERLLKYYYLFYVSQLAIKLNNMFEFDWDKPEAVYFSLDWEALSKVRMGYTHGWKLVNNHIRPLFSHQNCLEMLNHDDHGNVYSYQEIEKIVKEMSSDDKLEFARSLEVWKCLYQEYVQDVVWTELRVDRPFSEELFNDIYELFKMIEFQFDQAQSRGNRAQEYKKWFEEFCKLFFLKKRGSLGYTLNIDEEYLIFISQLCIGEKSKIRLKTLFEEYEKRGLYFDKESKDKIVQLFERLNLIEKKSDSGDAQYVKSIL